LEFGRRTLRSLGLLVASLALLCSLGAPASGLALESFSVLTYNVAGLPFGFSSSTPEVNNALISPRLNGFDLVGVQEDFGFHADLTSQLNHPFQSVKDTTDSADLVNLVGFSPGLGDGLNRFSRSPFAELTRVTWNSCFGLLTNASDCLAPKGFSVARHEFGPGAFVDVYNLHADAGGAPEDESTRRAQLLQLSAFIQTHSDGQAVIVLGDTNSRYTSAGDILPRLLDQTGLRDAWVELTRHGTHPEVGPKLAGCVADGLSSGECERIDKIFFRSGGNVELRPFDYRVEHDLFLDAAGQPPSDHEPVSVHFAISTVPEPSALLLLCFGLLALARRPMYRRLTTHASL